MLRPDEHPPKSTKIPFDIMKHRLNTGSRALTSAPWPPAPAVPLSAPAAAAAPAGPACSTGSSAVVPPPGQGTTTANGHRP